MPEEFAGANIAREVAVVPAVGVEPGYLLAVFSSDLFQDFTESGLRGIAYKGLNLGILRNFLVPLPPRSEQMRIVKKVENLMDQCDALRLTMEVALRASERVAAPLCVASA